jgi:hypothetical protein
MILRCQDPFPYQNLKKMSAKFTDNLKVTVPKEATVVKEATDVTREVTAVAKATVVAKATAAANRVMAFVPRITVLAKEAMARPLDNKAVPQAAVRAGLTTPCPYLSETWVSSTKVVLSIA